MVVPGIANGSLEAPAFGVQQNLSTGPADLYVVPIMLGWHLPRADVTTGFGIYARPSIRLLYGFQLSSQHAAFGNAFVERLDQFDAFKPTGTMSWHHLVSLESEGWF